MSRLFSLQRLVTITFALLFAVNCFAQQIPENTYQDLRWRAIGPFRASRVRAATGVPTQPNVFYMAPVNGGVWKTDDYGRTWQPIFDSQPTQSVGDIQVADSDPNTVYVASGEGLHRPDLSVGNGIYKSTDGGKTWKYTEALKDGQQIPRLAVDPRNAEHLFAAVLGHPYGPNEERGIFRSMDGGFTWKKVLYIDENTGGYDVVMDPKDPQVIYATMWESRHAPWEDKNDYSGTKGGVFKSTDYGATWTKLTKGLPENLVQANVALSPSNPNILYVVFSTTEKSEYATNKGMGFYRSDDAGETWRKAADDPRSAMKIGGGDLPYIEIDPKNPDVVYSAGIILAKTADGGKTWTSLKGAPGGDDYQNVWINPFNTDIIMTVADQGAVISVNGGKTWSSWYNQPTAQFYHVITTNEWPYKVCGGQQESGSACTLSRGNDGYISFRDWHPVNVIEYGYVAPDPLNPEVIFGAGRTEVSKYDWKTGQTQNITPLPIKGDFRAERTQPIMFSPIDNKTLFYAANVLFKSTDYGQTWQTISPDLAHPNPGIPPSVPMAAKDAKAAKQRGAIYALGLSYKNINTIWAGTDDGKVWITRDGGKKWTDITPRELTPWSKVTQIQASHYDDNTAYISVSRFRVDDLKPYIYRTHDGGKTWQLVVSGLADSPVNTVREDHLRKGLLFAGTETAVWVSFNDGDNWQPLQFNLPHTSMRDLWIHDNDLIVGTHGRSFWILDDITPLRQVKATMPDVHLYDPATAIRARRSTHAETPIPPDEALAQNPPDGAVIDYYLAQPASGVVTLEILDSAGKLVRKFASSDPPELTPDQLKTQMIPVYWVRIAPNPATEAGMHRFVWDLHYTAPTSVMHEYPITAVPGDTPRNPLGPTAVPGKYTVRLTANGKTVTVPLTIKMDPRVKTTQAGLQQMFAAEQKLADLVERSSVAVLQAKSVQEQIGKLKPTGAVADALKAFSSKVTAALDGPENPPAGAAKVTSLSDLNDHAYTLYGLVGQVDAAPTAAQLAALAKVEGEFPAGLAAWEQVVKTDLPGINAQLKQAGLAEINPQQKPEHGHSQGNFE
ncbi:MAG TPA: hypothetical protein VN577_04085 [Terriglobales bacterium]|nr:hypothetical protein [Terriglobales bacterium]